MINKQVIFNVGGAFSSYLEFDNNKVIIDLGKSEDFNPVENFLLPLAQKKFDKDPNTDKYSLEQLFLSHLDNDHISAIEEFDKHFQPKYLTAPCEHPKQNNIFDIVMDLFSDENENRDKVLQMMRTRLPGHGRRDPSDQNKSLEEDANKPLVVFPSCQESMELYHIPSNVCADDEELKKNYSNNLSLALFININGYTVFVPGDLMGEGMHYLIDANEKLKTDLKELGVDFLIAPHHGLTTSFPESLFEIMKNNKTQRLNIISEKIRKRILLENRSDVDSRYYSSDYSSGDNSLGQNGVKTSGGHIIIDYSDTSPLIKTIETDAVEDLVKEFI